MKRIACLMVALGVSSPVFAQSTRFTAPCQTHHHRRRRRSPRPALPPSPKPSALPVRGSGSPCSATTRFRSCTTAISTSDPTISQFGWQFEHEFYSKQDGPTVLNEWVFLLGGLDQGVAIPSLNWLVGLRTKEGTEFGIGPNITPARCGARGRRRRHAPRRRRSTCR